MQRQCSAALVANQATASCFIGCGQFGVPRNRLFVQWLWSSNPVTTLADSMDAEIRWLAGDSKNQSVS
jgi:hypothetical protein